MQNLGWLIMGLSWNQWWIETLGIGHGVMGSTDGCSEMAVVYGADRDGEFCM